MRRPKALGVVFAYEGPQPTSEASDKKLTSETGREKDTSSTRGVDRNSSSSRRRLLTRIGGGRAIKDKDRISIPRYTSDEF